MDILVNAAGPSIPMARTLASGRLRHPHTLPLTRPMTQASVKTPSWHVSQQARPEPPVPHREPSPCLSSPWEVEETLATNLVAPMHLCRAVVKPMVPFAQTLTLSQCVTSDRYARCGEEAGPF